MIDRLNQPCEKAGCDGKYRETCFFDDLDGLVSCSVCRERKQRWPQKRKFWEKDSPPCEDEPWIRTYTGGRVFFFSPEKSEITIDDVAHSLSLLCRFNGATKEFYSVAQHCCIIADAAPIEDKLEGLMHDSSEAFISDIPKPFKATFEGYLAKEKIFEEWLSRRFNYRYPYPCSVKKLDVKCLATEMRDLMKVSDETSLTEVPFPDRIKPWPWKKAKEEFLIRFYALSDLRK